MNWLERAAREISGMAGTPADETAKTSLSSVLAVPQMDISKESGAADADRAAPERSKPKFAGPLPTRPCATCMHFRAIPGDAPDGTLRAVQGGDLGRVRARLCSWLGATRAARLTRRCRSGRANLPAGTQPEPAELIAESVSYCLTFVCHPLTLVRC